MLATEILAEFIEQPQRAARLSAEGRAWPLGALALIVSGGSLFLAQALGRHFLPLASGPGSFAISCIWAVASGFLLAAAIHLIADAWGLRGSGTSLFVLIGLSELVWALLLPAALVLRAARADSWPVMLALLAAAAWQSVRLKARSIRHVYGIPAARAWALLSMPYLAGFVAVAAAAAVALVGAAVSLIKLFS